MDSEIYYRLCCRSWLLVNNSDPLSLLSFFGIVQAEKISWEEGYKKFIKLDSEEWNRVRDDSKNTTKAVENYSVMAFQLSKDWTMLFTHDFYVQNNALNTCSHLSAQFSKVYYFFWDNHIGCRRWIIFENGKLLRACEEDSDSVVSVLGELSFQEKEIFERALASDSSYFDEIEILALYIPELVSISYEVFKNLEFYFYHGPVQLLYEREELDWKQLEQQRIILWPLLFEKHEIEIKEERKYSEEDYLDDDLPF